MRGSSPVFEHKTKEKIMYNKPNEQMELEFDRNVIRAIAPRKRRRVPQAGWWFEQIRKMVDVNPPAIPRPVQGRLQFAPTR